MDILELILLMVVWAVIELHKGLIVMAAMVVLHERLLEEYYGAMNKWDFWFELSFLEKLL